MRKLIRRTVTIVITETWTIVWVDDAGVTDADGQAGQDEEAKSVLLIEEPVPVDTIVDAEKGVSTDEPATSPPGDAPDTIGVGERERSSNQDEEGGEM